ncbi:MAG: outer membrane lipoprotein-sorting protein [Chthoniobacterales bacterium]
MRCVITNRRSLGLTAAASFVAICLLSSPSGAEERTSAEQLLVHLDHIRQPARSYRADVAVSEFRQGKHERDATFHIFARKVGRGFDVLAACRTPPADRDKLFLATDQRLWFFDPRSARPVPISPNQARTHELILDLLGESFVSNYSAQVEGEQQVADAARRQFKCIALALSPRSSRGSPPVLRFWLQKENERPVKSEILASSGKTIRTIYYSDFRNMLAEERPTRLIMLNPAEGTVLELKFSNFSYFDPAASLFDVNRLPAALPFLKQSATE